MKILQVISYFSPKFGGDVNVCTNLSEELKKRNHEITIITTDFGFDPHYADGIRAEGITVLPFHCVANFGLFLYSPSIKIWLEKNLKEFDIIHFHNYRSYQNVVVHTYAMKLGIPFIVQAHGSVLPFFEKKILKRGFDIVWGERLLKDTLQVIALTQTEKNQYITMGVNEEKISIIPNGIDLMKYSKSNKYGVFRSKYSIPPNKKIILFLGRIHRIKGLDLLISAFSQAIKIQNNLILVIVGPDDGYLHEVYTSISKLQIANEVIITGPLFDSNKISAYIDADVFVLPSHFETFPITILEAMACGLPIITTLKSDDFDWINNKVGFVVENNQDSVASGIIKILKEHQLSKQFGTEGKNLVKERFNWNTISKTMETSTKDIVSQYEDIYERFGRLK